MHQGRRHLQDRIFKHRICDARRHGNYFQLPDSDDGNTTHGSLEWSHDGALSLNYTMQFKLPKVGTLVTRGLYALAYCALAGYFGTYLGYLPYMNVPGAERICTGFEYTRQHTNTTDDTSKDPSSGERFLQAHFIAIVFMYILCVLNVNE